MRVGKEAALLFAVLFLPGMLVQGSQVDPNSFESIRYHLNILVVVIPQLFLVLYVAGLSSPGYHKVLGWKRPQLRDITVGGLSLALICIVFVVVTAAAAAFEQWFPAEFSHGLTWRFSRYALTPLVLVTSMAVGYREEVFFRAYLLNRASELGLHRLASVTLAAFLFALGHLYQGIAAFALTFAIGMVLGFVYLRYRSLHGIAWAHGIFNTISLILSGTVLPT